MTAPSLLDELAEVVTLLDASDDELYSETDMHREGFESWMKGEGYCTEMYFGQYTPSIEKRWEGWCAAMRYRDEQEKQA